jgi:AcrR family transcriptional regulator
MPRTKEAFQHIRDESKQHILDKAADVFANKGLASTKISDLAEAAGISQGLLYRYFSSKEEVFTELLERAVHGAVQRAQAALEFPGTPWDRLFRLTEQFLKGMSREPMYHQIFSQALALPGRAREIVEELGALTDALRQLIIDGQAEGQIAKRDPDQLVLLYLCCLYGLAAGVGFYSRELMAHFPDAENILQILKA